jgi:nitroimidazol reductase NimA-like FMN-containing flavoprotein (pyridoxamine 5'-phosphate oxidase superfamily)
MPSPATRATPQPVTELDTPYSSDGAEPVMWSEASSELERAEVYWLSTVRPDERPHVTPIAAVWMDDAVYFSTGPEERKARNLVNNPRVVVTTGCNAFRRGLDVVVEGTAVAVRDESTLLQLADLFATKYEGHFDFAVRDGRFVHDGGAADVYRVVPEKAFAYGRGETFTATRYRFGGTD